MKEELKEINDKSVMITGRWGCISRSLGSAGDGEKKNPPGARLRNRRGGKLRGVKRKNFSLSSIPSQSKSGNGQFVHIGMVILTI